MSSHRQCPRCLAHFSKATCPAVKFAAHIRQCREEPGYNPFCLEQPKKRFNIILADPPWKYKSDKGLYGCAGDQYQTMSIDEICKLPVGEALAADTCALLLWTTGPMLEQAMRVINAWGFQYKTPMWVWVKRR